MDVKIFSRKGQEKDERAKAIEGGQVAKLRTNLEYQIKILEDERLKRLSALLNGKTLLADLHDERTNKRLLTKGTFVAPEVLRPSRRAT